MDWMLQLQILPILFTQEFYYKGRLWSVTVFPKLGPDEESDGEHVRSELNLLDSGATFGIQVVAVAFALVKGRTSMSSERATGPFRTPAYLNINRDEVLSNWVDKDGTLVIRMSIDTIILGSSRRWYPDEVNNLLDGGRSLLDNLEGADIVIAVGEEKETFQFHKCELFRRAPGLHELVKDVPYGEIIELPGINSLVLKKIYDYIYCGKLPTLDHYCSFASPELTKLLETKHLETKELLDCGNKFGCILFRLQMESEISRNYLNVGNAAEWLLFADGKTCPLLKEACLDIIKERFGAVKASPGWKQILEASFLMC